MVTSFMGTLKVDLFKSSYDPFVSLLEESGIEYKKINYPAGVIMNAGSAIEVISAISSISPWGALAIVLVAWVNKQSKRSVIITTKDNKIIHFNSQGYSSKEVESFLKDAGNITVIDASNKKN